MAEEIAVFARRRATIKGQLTRIYNFTVSLPLNLHDVEECRARLQKLHDLWKDFDNVQGRIEEFDTGEEQAQEREAFEASYYRTLAELKRRIEHRQDRRTNNEARARAELENTEDDSQINRVRLPTLELPKFDGAQTQWLHFRDTFQSLVDDNVKLGKIQKFHYLKSCLQGSAAESVQSIEISADNYEIAWDALRERFENKKLLVQKHIQALFDMSPIGKESAIQLRKLVDDTKKHVKVLKALGEPVDSWGSIIIYIVTTRVDVTTKRTWEAEIVKKESPTLEDLLEFLSSHCKVVEATQANRYVANKQTASSSTRRGDNANACVNRLAGINCTICQGDHPIYHCAKFRSMSSLAKSNEVRRCRLCFNCLRKDHTADKCSAGGCKRCGQKHNTLLHNDRRARAASVETGSKQGEPSTRDSSPETAKEIQTNVDNQTVYSVVSAAVKYSSQVLLATASVRIYDQCGNEHICRAFLDPGSQVNIVRRDLCKRLKLSERETGVSLSGIGCNVADTSGTVSATIHSTVNEFKVKLPFLVMNRITERAPSRRVELSRLNIPRNIRLSDRQFGEPGEVDILLGGGIFWDLLCVGQVKLGRSLPVLQKTKLGWIVAGNMPTTSGRSNQVCAASCAIVDEPDLNQQLERFWIMEEGLPKPKLSREQAYCEEEFQKTHKRASDGRFIVSLPFRENPSCLGDSRETALGRLQSVLRRLERDTNLKRQYVDAMEDYIGSGHMTRIREAKQAAGEAVHYLPHHAVVKEGRTTTKLRVVFDASCRTSSGRSLNDILEVGPQIQSELFEIILRFRQHQYVLTGDIERMYRQIDIDEKQRNLQRVLWKTDLALPAEEFMLNTVTFGVAAAPFLAVRCLHQLAHECRLEEPKISEIIRRDFYMDDLITGSDDVEDLKRIKEGVNRVLSMGRFPMHKWKSNLADVVEDHNLADENVKKPLGDQVKTLGLYWQVTGDALTYRVEAPAASRITKRKILAVVSQIYDPLGLVNPVIVQAKILLQRLWQDKVGWDESLPENLHTMWQKYCKQLKKLEEVSIPRRIVLTAPIRIEIHGFCDASEKAYGACLYLRSIDVRQERICRLICARSRVAPIKRISLPRLELCGALLLSRLMKKVVGALTLKAEEVHYWCDSTVVLAWIGGESSRWKTFVANRVTEIQELSSKSQWHHVRSEENPADILSRGVGPEGLKGRDLWWKGPSWLQKRHIEYSSEPTGLSEVPERKQMVMVINTKPQLEIWSRYSSLKRLKMVIAYCLRFIHNCRKVAERRSGWITVRETEDALNMAIKQHQERFFAQEIHDLRSGCSVSKKSRLIELNPFIDKGGLVRVGGRLKNAPISYSRKYPVILAARDQLTTLIIRDAHLRNLHAGPEALLGMLRETYWVLAGRSAIRRVLRRCLVCFRFNCKSPRELMGNLPVDRVSPGRAFLNVGVDYGGPFNIKVSRNKTAKAYLCLFVCLATRAIHLELVSDLSTTAFLNSLRRFIARRGKCQNIYSDNGTNFVGANNELKRLGELLGNRYHQQQVDAFATEQCIQWHFLPPYAPHMGGLWEAGMKSAKTRLKKVVGDALLTFEEFYTLLTEIEACLNSRPLMPMSRDPSDFVALTPGHFLIGTPLNAIQQTELSEVPTNRLTRYQLLIKLQQHFWTRWSQEYLSQLQSRSKWRSAASDQERIKPNDMVVLKDNQIPLKWKLGRVTEVHPDNEGHVRIVSVKTDTGIVQRALSKICILPMSEG